MTLEGIAELAICRLERGVANAVGRKAYVDKYKARFGAEWSDSTIFNLRDLVESYFLAETFAEKGMLPADRFKAAEAELKKLVEYELGRLEARAETYAGTGENREVRRDCILNGDGPYLTAMKDYLARK